MTAGVSQIVAGACAEVVRPAFFAVLIMVVSFLPDFALQGIDGRMYQPLAWTKTLTLLSVAFLAAVVVLYIACGLWAMNLVNSGCHRPNPYLPADAVARQIVETAFSTWKAGRKRGTTVASEEHMTLFDSRWQAGKKLESFEIDEEITGQPQPQFIVRLKLVGQPEETTTYMVVGVDPTFVIRQADYGKFIGQEK